MGIDCSDYSQAETQAYSRQVTHYPIEWPENTKKQSYEHSFHDKIYAEDAATPTDVVY